MEPTLFSTKNYEAGNQCHAWCEWFSPVFGIAKVQQDAEDFPAESAVWNIGDLVLSKISAPTVHVKRSRINLRRAPVDHWVLSFCSRGETAIWSDRFSLKSPAGIPFVWSLGEESESRRSHVERLQIMMPREAFQDISMTLDQARGKLLDSALGRLLGDYMISLERHLPELSEEDLPRLAAAVRSMIAACFAPTSDHIMEAHDQIELGQFERIRRFIRSNLYNVALQPTTISRDLGISRTQLYRLFEHVGGVVHYIQRQRLLEAHSIISDPNNRKPIAEVAEKLCFVDASGFSRAIKHEFGYTPSDAKLGSARLIPSSLQGQLKMHQPTRFNSFLLRS